MIEQNIFRNISCSSKWCLCRQWVSVFYYNKIKIKNNMKREYSGKNKFYIIFFILVFWYLTRIKKSIVLITYKQKGILADIE